MPKRRPGKRERASVREHEYREPNTVYVYTDGSAALFDGEWWGGWAAVLVYNDYVTEISGGVPGGTIGGMELTAILKGVQAVKSSYTGPVRVVSDSEYAVNALVKWWRQWRRNGWITSSGLEVQNREIIEEINATKPPTTTFSWVKGHAGHQFNERADVLATLARKQGMKEVMGAYEIPGGGVVYDPQHFGDVIVGSDGKDGFMIVRGKTILKVPAAQARDVAYALADRVWGLTKEGEAPIHRYSPNLAKAIDVTMTAPKVEPPPPPTPPAPRKRVRTIPVVA